MQQSVANDRLVIPSQDLSDQEEIRFKGIRKGAESPKEIPVKAIRHIQPQAVDLKIFDPVPDCLEDMPDHFLIAQVQTDKLIMTFPAIVPETVVIIGIPVKIDMEPVAVGRLFPLFLNIPELFESASDMVEHTVQDDPDPVIVQGPADIAEIVISAKPFIQLIVVPCIITVGIR